MSAGAVHTRTRRGMATCAGVASCDSCPAGTCGLGPISSATQGYPDLVVRPTRHGTPRPCARRRDTHPRSDERRAARPSGGLRPEPSAPNRAHTQPPWRMNGKARTEPPRCGGSQRTGIGAREGVALEDSGRRRARKPSTRSTRGDQGRGWSFVPRWPNDHPLTVVDRHRPVARSPCSVKVARL